MWSLSAGVGLAGIGGCGGGGAQVRPGRKVEAGLLTVRVPFSTLPLGATLAVRQAGPGPRCRGDCHVRLGPGKKPSVGRLAVAGHGSVGICPCTLSRPVGVASCCFFPPGTDGVWDDGGRGGPGAGVEQPCCGWLPGQGSCHQGRRWEEQLACTLSGRVLGGLRRFGAAATRELSPSSSKGTSAVNLFVPSPPLGPVMTVYVAGPVLLLPVRPCRGDHCLQKSSCFCRKTGYVMLSSAAVLWQDGRVHAAGDGNFPFSPLPLPGGPFPFCRSRSRGPFRPAGHRPHRCPFLLLSFWREHPTHGQRHADPR